MLFRFCACNRVAVEVAGFFCSPVSAGGVDSGAVGELGVEAAGCSLLAEAPGLAGCSLLAELAGLVAGAGVGFPAGSSLFAEAPGFDVLVGCKLLADVAGFWLADVVLAG